MTRRIDSVRIVLFDADDSSKFLILCEADDSENWKLPGGKLDKGELPDMAANRELLEELQVGRDQVGLMPYGELLNNDGVSKRYIYRGSIHSKLVMPSDEISSVRWITVDTLPEGPNKSHILSAVELIAA